jgi:hypothetical protein
VGGFADGAAIGLHLVGVLFESGGEAAAALSVCDEVEEVGMGRGQSGFEGGDSGIADGAGG